MTVALLFQLKKSASHKLGKQVQFKLSVVAADNPANIVMLQKIKEFFGNSGYISLEKGVRVLIISDTKTFVKIRDHFLKYPLMTPNSIF